MRELNWFAQFHVDHQSYPVISVDIELIYYIHLLYITICLYKQHLLFSCIASDLAFAIHSNTLVLGCYSRFSFSFQVSNAQPCPHYFMCNFFWLLSKFSMMYFSSLIFGLEFISVSWYFYQLCSRFWQSWLFSPLWNLFFCLPALQRVYQSRASRLIQAH